MLMSNVTPTLTLTLTLILILSLPYPEPKNQLLPSLLFFVVGSIIAGANAGSPWIDQIDQ